LIAGDQPIREHRQEGIIQAQCLLIADLLFIIGNDYGPEWQYPGVVDHLRKIMLHGLADTGIGDGPMLDQLAILIPVVVDPVKIAELGIELIIAQFEVDILKDQQAGGHAYRQTDDIDKGKDLVLADVPPGGGKIALEHSFGDWPY